MAGPDRFSDGEFRSAGTKTEERHRREELDRRLEQTEDEDLDFDLWLDTFHLADNSTSTVLGSASDLHERSAGMVNEAAPRYMTIDPRNSPDPRKGEALRTLGMYRGGHYTALNGAVRNETTDSHLLREVSQLDDAIDYWGVTNADPITVHRGVQGSYANQLRQTATSSPGSRLIDDGYMSTSADRELAASFVGNNGVMLEITVPAGRRSIAGTTYEQELIFPRGTSITVTGASEDGGTVFAEMA